MKKLLFALCLMVLTGPAFAISETHLLYVGSSTGNTHSTTDFFDGNLRALKVTLVGYGTVGSTTWENAGSPLAKSSAASATLLQDILAATRSAGTEWQDANATLDLILAASDASGTTLMASYLVQGEIRGAVQASATGMEKANVSLDAIEAAVRTTGTEMQAANGYLSAMDTDQRSKLTPAAQASATSLEALRAETVKMTPGASYTSTPFTCTSTESTVIVPGYPKLLKISVKGTECATCYVGVAVASTGEVKVGYVDADACDYAVPGVPVVIPLNGTVHTPTVYLDSVQAYDVKGSVSWQ